MGYIRISFAEAKQEYKKQEYQKRLQHSQEDIIVSLSEITEAKSGETGQHIRRVAEYSKCLAKHILKEPSDVENIRIAAMMHDIGKLMISQEILEKPGRLTPEEYAIVKEHSAFGWNLLANSKGEVMEMARGIALEHHERWDGGGYPGGLKGDEISIYAQIVSVADVYDALTSKRSYKDAWNPDDARREIVVQRGKQFAPRVVDAFVSCYSEIEEIRRQYADTI
jgi:response regulator RpfG family c-di-GMP phosphodiesterase